jgi:cellulose synthase (UDP-forming)
VLDDGDSPAVRAMVQAEGAGYIVRSPDWEGRTRHAKAGNLNNALFQTSGEFVLILDADQIPAPEILDRTLGYFTDERVAFVQTPQWFYNVPPDDPLGSQAPLFYGPIQQGKDGWNAAFFCGSNGVLRRDALMQAGITRYVADLAERVPRTLRAADRLLDQAETRLKAGEGLEPRDAERARTAVRELRDAVRAARAALRAGAAIQEVTWEFQRRAQAVSSQLVAGDLDDIRIALADLPGVDARDLDPDLAGVLQNDAARRALAGRDSSPLAALEAVRHLLLTVDVDRQDEAQPIMPLATISVTEDMATSMRLHALGWRSVYHHETLARGLAPVDLRSSLQQRLRWAQGTVQVLLRENPLFRRGLGVGQRLMYLATMWSYLYGFFAPVYLVAPALYLLLGIKPVQAYSADFFVHLVPYLLANQLVFAVAGWGIPTWRGQQYNLALFPLWVRAVLGAAGNVWLGRKLSFVVTPKTRAGRPGNQLRLVLPQVGAMLVLVIASLVGVGRLALGLTGDVVAILANVFWAGYIVVNLGVVFGAAAHRGVAAEAAWPA